MGNLYVATPILEHREPFKEVCGVSISEGLTNMLPPTQEQRLRQDINKLRYKEIRLTKKGQTTMAAKTRLKREYMQTELEQFYDDINRLTDIRWA